MRATHNVHSASALRRAGHPAGRAQASDKPVRAKAKSSRSDERSTRRLRRQLGSSVTETLSPEMRRAQWRDEKRRRLPRPGEIPAAVGALVEETKRRVLQLPPRKVIAAVSGVAALFIALFVFFSMLPGFVLSASAPVEVKLDIDAPELDASGSRIPILVKSGDEAYGLYFVDAQGEGLALPPGDHTVEVAGSPIAEDGSIYGFKPEPKSLSVTRGKADASQVGTLSFEQLPAEETTREDINAAYAFAAKGGCRADKAAQLKVLALERIGIEPFDKA